MIATLATKYCNEGGLVIYDSFFFVFRVFGHNYGTHIHLFLEKLGLKKPHIFSIITLQNAFLFGSIRQKTLFIITFCACNLLNTIKNLNFAHLNNICDT